MLQTILGASSCRHLGVLHRLASSLLAFPSASPFSSAAFSNGSDSHFQKWSRDQPSGGFRPRNQQQQTLETINWDGLKLKPLSTNVYSEHSATRALTADEVTLFRAKHSIVVTGTNPPNPILQFEHMNLPADILSRLQSLNLLTPTHIQAQAMPVALLGQDLIGRAETGSGKTLAYLLPAVVHLQHHTTERYTGPTVLVLAPTRELATQIRQDLARVSNVRSACLYGGASKMGQLQELNSNPSIVVATPGRLIDFLSNGAVDLRNVSYVVVDEADRMMDIGFEPQLREILGQIRPDRQTLMWSATWPDQVQFLANDFLKKDAIQVICGAAELHANPAVAQSLVILDAKSDHSKQDRLAQILEQHQGCKTLVFCETKLECEVVARHLLRNTTQSVVCLHGDKSQQHRDQAIARFKSHGGGLMVATDVAARGLDVKGVGLVVNFSLPRSIESYIHRIGRTGRAGAKGKSITFIEPPFSSSALQELLNVMKEAKQNVPQELYETIREARVAETNFRAAKRGGSRSGTPSRSHSGAGRRDGRGWAGRGRDENRNKQDSSESNGDRAF